MTAAAFDDDRGAPSPRPSPRRGAAVGALLLAAAATLPAPSAEIRSLDVTRERGRYELVAETHLAAPAQAIFDVLVDYEDGRFGRISSVYKESDYLEPAPDGTPIVYTRMEGCLLRWFCKSMRRVERLEVDEPHMIRTTALPERSDFTYSRSEWLLKPVPEGGTEVKYTLIMEPDFWVPPVIGPWFLERTLMKGGTRAINRIERLARGEPPRYWRRDGAPRDEESREASLRGDAPQGDVSRRDASRGDEARGDVLRGTASHGDALSGDAPRDLVTQASAPASSDAAPPD